MLTVGGWFDAEDLQGPFSAFHAIEEYNPDADNHLVIGPWIHGGWARLDGHKLGYVNFDANTADYYRQYIVFPFFEQHLKDAPDAKIAKATVFETGTNVWRHYPSWPPPGTEPRTLYFQPAGGLTMAAAQPTTGRGGPRHLCQRPEQARAVPAVLRGGGAAGIHDRATSVSPRRAPTC